jgi:bifunctional non-homologous end joining protein LigD
MIAEQRHRPYRSGRKGDWFKIKCVQRETFLVVGYEPSTKGARRRRYSAAGRAQRWTTGLRGSVGTGFSYNQAVSFKKLFDSMKVATPSISQKRKGAGFVPPTLAAKFEFLAGPAREATARLIQRDARSGGSYRGV